MNNYSYVECPYCGKLTVCNSDFEYCADVRHIYNAWLNSNWNRITIVSNKVADQLLADWMLQISYNSSFWNSELRIRGLEKPFIDSGNNVDEMKGQLKNMEKEAEETYQKWKAWL